MNAIETFYDKRVTKTYKTNIPIKFMAPYNFAYEVISNYAKPGMKILDLGCGTGLHIPFFQSLGLNITGVDLSQKSLDICKYQNKNIHNIQLVQSDIESYLSKQTEKFDIIFISGTLYYLNLQPTLQNIRDHLQPNGLFVCIDTNGDNYILNLYRNIKSLFFKHRDEQTKNNLLTKQKINTCIKPLFPNFRIRYFDFLSIYLSPLSSITFFYIALNYLDKLLFTRFIFHKFCFKFVIIAKNEKL